MPNLKFAICFCLNSAHKECKHMFIQGFLLIMYTKVLDMAMTDCFGIYRTQENMCYYGCFWQWVCTDLHHSATINTVISHVGRSVYTLYRETRVCSLVYPGVPLASVSMFTLRDYLLALLKFLALAHAIYTQLNILHSLAVCLLNKLEFRHLCCMNICNKTFPLQNL